MSSSVSKDPDYIMGMQLEVLRVLRKIGYFGYIHLRIMPGTSFYLIREAVELADRVGVNVEAPNKDVFSELCPDKGGFREAIIKRLTWIVREVQRAKHVSETNLWVCQSWRGHPNDCWSRRRQRLAVSPSYGMAIQETRLEKSLLQRV